MRNCEYRALDWAERLVDINGNSNDKKIGELIYHVFSSDRLTANDANCQ